MNFAQTDNNGNFETKVTYSPFGETGEYTLRITDTFGSKDYPIHLNLKTYQKDVFVLEPQTLIVSDKIDFMGKAKTFEASQSIYLVFYSQDEKSIGHILAVMSEDGTFRFLSSLEQLQAEHQNNYNIKIPAGKYNGQIQHYGLTRDFPNILIIPSNGEPVQDSDMINSQKKPSNNDELKNQIMFLEDKIDKVNDDNFQLQAENKRLKNQNNILQEKLDNLQDTIYEQIKVIMEILQDLKNQ